VKSLGRIFGIENLAFLKGGISFGLTEGFQMLVLLMLGFKFAKMLPVYRGAAKKYYLLSVFEGPFKSVHYVEVISP
jgi:hypothetical protein